MDNGLTFRFQASDIESLMKELDPKKNDHILITYYLEPIPHTNTALMRSKAESFRQETIGSPSAPTGHSKQGCPVPPCALKSEGLQDPECIKIMEEILKAAGAK